MKQLNPFETDALTELFNIGLHRAAASLSDLTGQRVLVDLPQLWVCPISDLHDRLLHLVGGELATVHQIFRGEVAGDAVLVLEYEKAALLASLMTSGEVAHHGVLDESAREVLAEIGNIVLSACLSAFGNVLKVAVSFSVPRMHVESLNGMLRSLLVDEESDVHYALLAATRFRLSELEVGGYLVIVLGVNSLSRASAALSQNLE
jgi:chemotaxis protein CheC